MSHPVGRVSSDLSGSNYATATMGLHHQSTSNNDDSINGASKARQRLLLLFSGVGAWRRGQGGGGTTDDSGSKKRQVNSGSSKRGALDVGQVVKKYTSMVEQLFITSFSGGRERERRRRELWRRRPHSFASAGGSWNVESKRHRGRLSSAPASLRGSPGNSGHLSVSMSSEESTMEELQSAIQAAIAHCKNSSIAVATHAGGDKCNY